MLFHRLLSAVSSVLIVPVALSACSSTDTAAPPAVVDAGRDGSTTTTTTPDAGRTDLPAPDSGTGAKVAVRCTQADFDADNALGKGGDYTKFGGADISFPLTAAPAQYNLPCVKVKVGSGITFFGNFQLHPLEPNGGDIPTPIPTQAAKTPMDTLTFNVPTAGTFGYQCSFHAGTMFGAIQVVP